MPNRNKLKNLQRQYPLLISQLGIPENQSVDDEYPYILRTHWESSPITHERPLPTSLFDLSAKSTIVNSQSARVKRITATKTERSSSREDNIEEIFDR